MVLSTASAPAGMLWIPSGTFCMGSDRHYPEERPAHRVSVDGFWMDAGAVTNAEFAAFIDATGYRSLAERPLDLALYPDAKPELAVPGALVFHMTDGPVDTHDMSNWWSYVPGACWRHPEGRTSSVVARESHPVVQVAFEDAEAYAAWTGKELPTEAEWEFAARGGLDNAEFVWGDEFLPEGRHLANTWQGPFPWRNFAEDGYDGTAPVGSYPANGYGLFDMAGNVWEWTTDWFAGIHPEHAEHACCVPANPRGAPIEASYDARQRRIRIPRKVVKGGSFRCIKRPKPGAVHGLGS
jgi:sulfatase modifying factor 1